VRATRETGNRLMVMTLDPQVDSRGLQDVGKLFGKVLDCKVEMDADGRSMGLGFIHFATAEDATKAVTCLDGTQIGDSVVEVRQFDESDKAFFAGCGYYIAGEDEDSDEKESPRPGQMLQSLFKSLEYHHVEVQEDATAQPPPLVPIWKAKLKRLQALIELYTPSHDQQMMVVADSTNCKAVADAIGEICEEVDFECVDNSSSKDARRNAVESFETGNTYILVMASEVASRMDFELSTTPAVLVNFDMPSTLLLYLYRITKRAESMTRIHSFFDPKLDGKLALPLMAAMEEAGQDIPPPLLGFWAGVDRQVDS